MSLRLKINQNSEPAVLPNGMTHSMDPQHMGVVK